MNKRKILDRIYDLKLDSKLTDILRELVLEVFYNTVVINDHEERIVKMK